MRMDNWLGRRVAALAVCLMAMLVLQSPVVNLDRSLHALGQNHHANGFAGAVIKLVDDQDHHHAEKAVDDHHEKGASSAPADDPQAETPDAPQPAPHHHHHDAPSVFGLVASLAFALAPESQEVLIAAPVRQLSGQDVPQQDRPPKTFLEHTA